MYTNAYLVYSMLHGKRNNCKVRVFSSSSWVHSNKKRSPCRNKQLDGHAEHALQITLFKTLVNAAESNTTHL